MSFFSLLWTFLIGPLKLLFEVIFDTAYDLVLSPGVAIIMLSLAMNFLVLPLYRRADLLQSQQRDREMQLKRWTDHIKKTYGEFLRKHHISPEAVKDYLAMEGATFKKAFDAAKEKEAAETKAIKENFDAQGEALKKNFSEAQIETAVGALSTFADDKDFMQIATTNLSNNSTLVKLLLNWAEHHKVDGTTGAGQGQGSGGLSGFAERWTGKKI